MGVLRRAAFQLLDSGVGFQDREGGAGIDDVFVTLQIDVFTFFIIPFLHHPVQELLRMIRGCRRSLRNGIGIVQIQGCITRRVRTAVGVILDADAFRADEFGPPLGVEIQLSGNPETSCDRIGVGSFTFNIAVFVHDVRHIDSFVIWRSNGGIIQNKAARVKDLCAGFVQVPADKPVSGPRAGGRADLFA